MQEEHGQVKDEFKIDIGGKEHDVISANMKAFGQLQAKFTIELGDAEVPKLKSKAVIMTPRGKMDGVIISTALPNESTELTLHIKLDVGSIDMVTGE